MTKASNRLDQLIKICSNHILVAILVFWLPPWYFNRIGRKLIAAIELWLIQLIFYCPNRFPTNLFSGCIYAFKSILGIIVIIALDIFNIITIIIIIIIMIIIIMIIIIIIMMRILIIIVAFFGKN